MPFLIALPSTYTFQSDGHGLYSRNLRILESDELSCDGCILLGLSSCSAIIWNIMLPSFAKTVLIILCRQKRFSCIWFIQGNHGDTCISDLSDTQLQNDSASSKIIDGHLGSSRIDEVEKGKSEGEEHFENTLVMTAHDKTNRGWNEDLKLYLILQV